MKDERRKHVEHNSGAEKLNDDGKEEEKRRRRWKKRNVAKEAMSERENEMTTFKSIMLVIIFPFILTFTSCLLFIQRNHSSIHDFVETERYKFFSVLLSLFGVDVNSLKLL